MSVMEEPCGYPHIEGKFPLELIMLLDFAPFHQSFSLKSTSHRFIYLFIFMTCKKHCLGFESC
jgi:hypothetical protein